MDRGKLKKLNGYHVVFLVQSAMAGIGVLSLPNSLSPVGYNQWIIVLIMGVIASITLFPMVALCLKYPEDTLFTIHKKLLGKWFGKLATFIWIIYGILGLARVSRHYSFLAQAVLLPEKSILLPLFLIYTVSLYIVLGGIKSVARFSIASFFLTVWLTYYSQWPLGLGNFYHLLPSFDFSFKEFINALFSGYDAMLGYGFIMIYFPYIINQKKTFKHGLLGVWITTILYLLTSVASVVYFSKWQLINLTFPLLNLLKAIQLSFVQRIDTLLVGLWVLLVLSTMAPYLWVTKKAFDVVLGSKRNLHLYGAASISFFISVGPIAEKVRDILLEQVSINLGYSILLWPLPLLVIHSIKRRKERKQ
ncbi:GerAB/ArcD/ProY family transporter [Alkaliphilus transvaalensis]|uniref:GerAB/ArcD/ProY family transporter n=1 Tax=Alkaliphilus transvaalensis TaxID=114628 RepID=UPI00047E6678|nr:GerAB/ArcD/ProY family transporter [Alkaliphilus transvaalensis]